MRTFFSDSFSVTASHQPSGFLVNERSKMPPLSAPPPALAFKVMALSPPSESNSGYRPSKYKNVLPSSNFPAVQKNPKRLGRMKKLVKPVCLRVLSVPFFLTQ